MAPDDAARRRPAPPTGDPVPPPDGAPVPPEAAPPEPDDPPTQPRTARDDRPPRPTRPPVGSVAAPPPLTPPEPPAALRIAARCWRFAAAGLGLAVGLIILGLAGQRTRLREVVAERASGLADSDIALATNIVLVGSLVTWGVLAVLALIVGGRIIRASFAPRLLGLLLLVLILGVVAFTVVPLTGGGGLALAARICLLAGSAATVVAALSGLWPGTWRWVRQNRAGAGSRPASAPAPGPPPPSRGR